MASLQVVVIGGGISGTAAAWELARRGADVTLLEQGDLASMASGWTLAGVRQSGRHPAELPLAQAAVRRWQHLHDELEADTYYRQKGNLRLALTEDEVEIISQVVTDGNAAGIDMTFIPDAAGIREIAPAISEDVFAASYCPSDGHANPTATVHAFARAAVRAGAVIETGCEVTGILTIGGRVTGVATSNGENHAADVVIVAAGVYTPVLLQPLGLDLPIRITHVPVVQTVPVPHELDQVIGVATGHFAGRQEVSGRYRLTVGSTPWDGTRHTTHSVMPKLEQLVDTVASSVQVLPGLKDVRIGNVWGGLIDRTPDVLPVIERSSQVEGLVMAAGFSGHGFCLGPVTGEILADLALTGQTSYPIAPFALDRFAGTGTQAESLQLHG